MQSNHAINPGMYPKSENKKTCEEPLNRRLLPCSLHSQIKSLARLCRRREEGERTASFFPWTRLLDKPLSSKVLRSATFQTNV